jgi:hypothetical protein
MWVYRGTALAFLRSAVDGVVRFVPLLLSHKYWIGGWVGHRAYLNTVKETKTLALSGIEHVPFNP